MSNIDIWFPFYYGDYLKDTMQLSAERHGIYLLLMIHCWQNESIEDDIDSIAMIAKVQPDNKSLNYILDKYFVKKDNKYYQNRITKELKCAKENKAKNHEKARKAANARWNNDATSNATSMLQASPKQCLSNATSDAKTVLEQCPSPSPSPSSSHIPLPKQSDIEKPKRKRFTPPTYEEVMNYTLEKGYTVDPQRFINYYESKGWLVGKVKMKSWKAAVSNWATNDYSGQKKYSAAEIIDEELMPWK